MAGMSKENEEGGGKTWLIISLCLFLVREVEEFLQGGMNVDVIDYSCTRAQRRDHQFPVKTYIKRAGPSLTLPQVSLLIACYSPRELTDWPLSMHVPGFLL
jgi:hypothetical protein